MVIFFRLAVIFQPLIRFAEIVVQIAHQPFIVLFVPIFGGFGSIIECLLVIVEMVAVIGHIVEGKSVFYYEKPQIGGGNVENFDPAIKKDGMPLTEGFISLQSESHPIEFRKVQLLDLAPHKNDKPTLKSIIERETNYKIDW